MIRDTPNSAGPALRLFTEEALSPVETYRTHAGEIIRSVACRDGSSAESRISGAAKPHADLACAYDKAWLVCPQRPALPRGTPLRVADLFAGCGGLTLGLQEAGRALGKPVAAAFANDLAEDALDIYRLNFPEAHVECRPIQELVDGATGAALTSAERDLKARIGRIDILLGGPPCQGHSDLNNRTRRTDPRNELYMRMARFCEIFEPEHVVIENVPGVLHDKGRVAQRTWDCLRAHGYHVAAPGLLDAHVLGVAQRRKRCITLASKTREPRLDRLLAEHRVDPRPVSWAIGDLLEIGSRGVFDSAAQPSRSNMSRINYLFDRDIDNLPDAQRPDCHRLKPHSYVSMYGRMSWDRPAQTLTTGFGCMGRGRFVHPRERRTITPHEAARLQGFPDFYRFFPHDREPRRTTLQRVIGNAVPSKLGYAIGLHLLR